ncbi:MAG: DUF4363 family protein [Clostridia bacterium]|nr:DUF4363 family protein [Clostridia bacterium]
MRKGKAMRDERFVEAHTEKLLRTQARAGRLALCAFALLLAASFVFSTLSIASLERRLGPLLDEAHEAAQAGELERVERAARRIDAVLRAYESAMKIYASHRDITDLMRCSGELTALGASGERDDYLESIAGIRALIGMLEENNRVCIGNIL